MATDTEPRTCFRCGRTLRPGEGMRVWPPRRDINAPWLPLPMDKVLMCIEDGKNGGNTLTEAEYERYATPAGQGTLLGVPETGPALPYSDPVAGRSSGWSGSETSAARARRDDADGTTSKRQRLVMMLLSDAGVRGLTWKDLGRATGMHHGQASGALSNLHKTGRIARLAETRDRCKVYVLHPNVAGRDAEPYGGREAPEWEWSKDTLIAAWRAGWEARSMFPGPGPLDPGTNNPYEEETDGGR